MREGSYKHATAEMLYWPSCCTEKSQTRDCQQPPIHCISSSSFRGACRWKVLDQDQGRLIIHLRNLAPDSKRQQLDTPRSLYLDPACPIRTPSTVVVTTGADHSWRPKSGKELVMASRTDKGNRGRRPYPIPLSLAQPSSLIKHLLQRLVL